MLLRLSAACWHPYRRNLKKLRPDAATFGVPYRLRVVNKRENLRFSELM
jgi:hypothetical protein